jgi:epoxyqueuosine reductase
MHASEYKSFIRQRAHELGFAYVGIAAARRLDAEATQLQDWLQRGFHGKMAYMANYFDLRTDPQQLVPGAKSVISLVFNYFPKGRPLHANAPRIARYAYGEDYHKVLRRKLKSLLRDIREEIGDVQGRCFVDSAPVMERQWASLAGAGWLGKNTLLIRPREGSYFFLSEIILDLDLEPDTPIGDFCGTCTRCIDACPTQAIAPQGYLLDASRCISYLTIELHAAIPDEFLGRMENWIFGCDICQEVCPWNRFARPHDEPAFRPAEGLLELSRRDWLEMTEEVFGRVLGHTAAQRVKFAGLRRNLDFVAGDEQV